MKKRDRSIQFVTRCGWCDKEMKRETMESNIYIHDVVSHGICRRCKRKLLRENRNDRKGE